ncbi:protein UPSTREAM OF FLC-like [Dorcoceras hygrometricum]|uniref:Protein UPSTREAM OF FLC-like n=1 Tax=Dorcoceras hygrometricum TaxID=472368 RepID=A0A2Z7AKM6_9LAMI|nr:protein UPSTREAM OF FLC-like [Dorcoceras hygrometricum]
MTERMKKYRQVSPDRAKVLTEKSPKYQQRQRQRHNRAVPVVYYLCKNRRLEHPHFMEVTLSSPDGLYLRDVIERLSVLRGRGMTSMYSWSCKRSYKNGFVWHDLCDNDLILPAHGNEYVLKGSELFEESVSGGFSPAGVTLQCVKVLPDPQSSKSQEESSSSSSLNGRFRKSSPDDGHSTPVQCPCSSSVSPDSSHRKSSARNGSLSLTEYKVYENNGLADASTQTEGNVSRVVETQSTCTRGVSTDDELSENPIPRVTGTSEICGISTPPSTSSASSSSDWTDTLESLIRTDAQKFNSFGMIEEDDFRIPSNVKLRASNMLLQLISCGSFSVKDHRFGLIPTYKPRFSYSKFPCPMFSTSFMLGELDFHAENPSPVIKKVEDKECFARSFVGKNTIKEVVSTPKQSSSFISDSKQLDSIQKKVESSSSHSKWIPRSIKSSLGTQLGSESVRSPLSDGERIEQSSRSTTRDMPTTNIRSDRISNHFSVETRSQPTKLDSVRNGEENVFKIEESKVFARLSSNTTSCS